MDKFVNKVATVIKNAKKYRKETNELKKSNAKMAKKLLPLTIGKALIKDNKVSYQGSNGKVHNRKIKSLADFKKHFDIVPKKSAKPASKYSISKYRQSAK